MQKSLVVGFVVLLAALSAFWLLRDESSSPLRSDVQAATGPPPTAASPVTADAAMVREQPVVAVPARVAVPDVGLARPLCILRGRCVDVAGQPIAGVNAHLLGWGGNEERVAAWRKQHGEPERVQEKVTTAADGVFEFRFWPPPPFLFGLRLQGGGVATRSERWNELPAGETKDLGDLRFERGTLLRGRVIDADGAPLGQVQVRVTAVVGQRADSSVEQWCDGRTKVDGAFVCRWALAAGEYDLDIDGRVIERNARVTLLGDGADQVIDVVVKKLDAAEAISGVIVDQDGAPVSGAMIFPSLDGNGRLITSDREGRFRVQRPEEQAPGQITLHVQSDGYEPRAETEAYAWGRTDVRLVLRKGQGLEVQVVRASDGAPVEDYALRVMQIGSMSSNDTRPRGKAPHAGGRESVPGVRVGRHQVIVEPIGDELAIGTALVEVGTAGVPPVVVRLTANASRLVRVQLADGTPVAGAMVQLVDPFGQPLTDKLTVCALGQWGYTSAQKALELAVATTDARGEAALRVPADRLVGLCLPGPVHAPLLVPEVVFPTEGPFVVTVSKGACLKGVIGPATAIGEIRRLAGIREGAEARRAQWPLLYLTRGEPMARVRFPELRVRNSMQPDGTFELAGAPSGRWNVVVQCFRQDKGGRGGTFLEEVRAVVDLVDGQTTTIALDLASMLPGELEGLVVHNGAPLAATQLSLECPLGKVNEGEQQSFSEQVTTDGDGRFRTTIRRGEIRLSWGRSRDDQSWLALRASELAVVMDGQLTRQTFTLQSGTVKIRLLDAAGAAVGKVAIELRDAAGMPRLTLPRTDDAGLVECECEVASFIAWVLPKRLQDQKALSDFFQAHPGTSDPTATVRMNLGTVTTRLGETVELELRLPAGWEK